MIPPVRDRVLCPCTCTGPQNLLLLKRGAGAGQRRKSVKRASQCCRGQPPEVTQRLGFIICFTMMPTGFGLRGPLQRFTNAGKLEEQAVHVPAELHPQFSNNGPTGI